MDRSKEKISKKYKNLLLVFSGVICLFIISINYGCIPQYSINENWPMYKYNVQRTGANKSVEFNSIKLIWKYEYELNEKGGDSRISPAISSNMVVVSTRTYISCFKISDGQLIWSKYIGENYSSPVIHKGNVIISSINSISAFNVKDGSSIWNKNLAKEKENITAGISVPAIVNDKIYYGLRGKDDNEGYLLCLDALNGSTVWNYRVAGPVRTSPVVFNDRVFFGSDDGSIYCLDANSGAYIWNYNSRDKMRSSPAISSNRIVFGSNNTYIYCLDIEDGKYIWSFKTGDAVSATPAISDNKIFVVSTDKYVYSLDIDNGKFLWKYSMGVSPYTSPTICGCRVLLGLEDEIHCLNAEDGSLVFTHKLNDYGTSTPLAVHNGKLYFRTASFLYCFELQ